MELKQLQSFVAVVKCNSFTKAAEKLYVSQPTVSAHVHALEEELQVSLIIRTTKSIQVTQHGIELYECANNMLELRDSLLKRWTEKTPKIIELGASTIPSAYILPKLLPKYGKLHGDTYFSIHQSDSKGVIDGILQGRFDIGLIGMYPQEDSLECIPFCKDRMVLVTPVNEHFLKHLELKTTPFELLRMEPVIMREKGSGSRKSTDRFFESIGITEEMLTVSARINDQESVKNLVAGGLGISIISEKAAENFIEEKRLLKFSLPEQTSERDLYIIYRKSPYLKDFIQEFTAFAQINS